jgi:hypothetical protein
LLGDYFILKNYILIYYDLFDIFENSKKNVNNNIILLFNTEYFNNVYIKKQYYNNNDVIKYNIINISTFFKDILIIIKETTNLIYNISIFINYFMLNIWLIILIIIYLIIKK